MTNKRVMITDGEGAEWIRLDIFPDRGLVYFYLVPPADLKIADELVDIMTKSDAEALAKALTENW